jgi:hypothetical protein
VTIVVGKISLAQGLAKGNAGPEGKDTPLTNISEELIV